MSSIKKRWKQRGWAKTSFSHIKNEQFQLGVARFPLHAL